MERTMAIACADPRARGSTQRPARPRRRRLRNAAAFFAIALASLASADHAVADDKAGLFSPLCRWLDLEVTGFIERHSEVGEISSERLGKAGLQFLAARVACLQGRSDEGADLYRGILRIEPVVASVNK
jgi:hypothetical protein